MARVLKDSFSYGITTKYWQRLPCVKGAVAKRLRDCFRLILAFYNPSVTALPCHLPLHKGGFLFVCKCALTHHLLWLFVIE